MSTAEKMPRDTALVLVAHGERQVPDPNRALADHAAALAIRDDFCFVGYGVLNGEPPFEAALEEATKSGAGNLLVYPFFMSDGYFVSTVLPERTAAARAAIAPIILPPLGLDADLVDLMLKRAETEARGARLAPGETQLLVVGHGSKTEPESAEATRRVAAALATAELFMGVSAAFIEEPPFVGDQLAREKSPVVVSGFFAGNGMHSSQDVHAAIKASGARAVYAGPIGAEPAIRDLIVAACENSSAGRR
ncbi:MAG: hypothetical protein OEM91_14205 [Hyphomicrobiales bacterium]|nr:hypothetical protein [Hyphomicrobiales bacterium]